LRKQQPAGLAQGDRQRLGLRLKAALGIRVRHQALNLVENDFSTDRCGATQLLERIPRAFAPRQGSDGRAQPFAPGYQVSAAAEYQDPHGWFARLDSHAIDSFYYYTSDAQTSHSYHLENLRVGFRHGAWTASVWVRNLFNVQYAQQGFYFGLIPPNYPNQSFLQLGDPRQIGLTIDYDLQR